FSEPQGSRAGLGALVLGVYDGGELVCIGHAGSGFTGKSLAELRSRLDGLVQKTCPFKKRPRSKTRVHWVRPELVCEVSFAAWTKDGHMRFPVFLGLREDKEAATVQRENPAKPDKPEMEDADPPPQPRQVQDGRSVPVTNLGKVYWPSEGYTKGDL